MNGQSERLQALTTKSASMVRGFCVSILFIVGIISAVASSQFNPAPTVIGPHSSQINKLEGQLYNLEIQLASHSRNARYSYSSNYNPGRNLREDIEETKKKLAALRAKAAQAMSSQSGGCFTGDMWVLTDHGAKPIVDIKVGDKVLSFTDDGNQVAADVLKAWGDRNYHYFLINDKIKVTALHRFLTKDGWKKTRELKVGDQLQMNSGIFERIFSIEWFAENLDVYNLTISENHNFYISADGQNGYLVHNTEGGHGGEGGGRLTK